MHATQECIASRTSSHGLVRVSSRDGLRLEASAAPPAIAPPSPSQDGGAPASAALDVLSRAVEELPPQWPALQELQQAMRRLMALERRRERGASDLAYSCRLQVVEMCNALAMKLLGRGADAEAHTLLKAAESLIPRGSLHAAVTANNLACYYRRNGHVRFALRHLRRAVDIETALGGARADTLLNLSAVAADIGDCDAGIRHAQQALVLLGRELKERRESIEEWSKQNPRPARWREELEGQRQQAAERVAVLAMAHHSLGVLLQERGLLEAAMQTYAEGGATASAELGAQHPVALELRAAWSAAMRERKAAECSAPADMPAAASQRSGRLSPLHHVPTAAEARHAPSHSGKPPLDRLAERPRLNAAGETRGHTNQLAAIKKPTAAPRPRAPRRSAIQPPPSVPAASRPPQADLTTTRSPPPAASSSRQQSSCPPAPTPATAAVQPGVTDSPPEGCSSTPSSSAREHAPPGPVSRADEGPPIHEGAEAAERGEVAEPLLGREANAGEAPPREPEACSRLLREDSTPRSREGSSRLLREDSTPRSREGSSRLLREDSTPSREGSSRRLNEDSAPRSREGCTRRMSPRSREGSSRRLREGSSRRLREGSSRRLISSDSNDHILEGQLWTAPPEQEMTPAELAAARREALQKAILEEVQTNAAAIERQAAMRAADAATAAAKVEREECEAAAAAQEAMRVAAREWREQAAAAAARDAEEKKAAEQAAARERARIRDERQTSALFIQAKREAQLWARRRDAARAHRLELDAKREAAEAEERAAKSLVTWTEQRAARERKDALLAVRELVEARDAHTRRALEMKDRLAAQYEAEGRLARKRTQAQQVEDDGLRRMREARAQDMEVRRQLGRIQQGQVLFRPAEGGAVMSAKELEASGKLSVQQALELINEDAAAMAKLRVWTDDRNFRRAVRQHPRRSMDETDTLAIDDRAPEQVTFRCDSDRESALTRMNGLEEMHAAATARLTSGDNRDCGRRTASEDGGRFECDHGPSEAPSSETLVERDTCEATMWSSPCVEPVRTAMMEWIRSTIQRTRPNEAAPWMETPHGVRRKYVVACETSSTTGTIATTAALEHSPDGSTLTHPHISWSRSVVTCDASLTCIQETELGYHDDTELGYHDEMNSLSAHRITPVYLPHTTSCKLEESALATAGRVPAPSPSADVFRWGVSADGEDFGPGVEAVEKSAAARIQAVFRANKSRAAFELQKPALMKAAAERAEAAREAALIAAEAEAREAAREAEAVAREAAKEAEAAAAREAEMQRKLDEAEAVMARLEAEKAEIKRRRMWAAQAAQEVEMSLAEERRRDALRAEMRRKEEAKAEAAAAARAAHVIKLAEERAEAQRKLQAKIAEYRGPEGELHAAVRLQAVWRGRMEREELWYDRINETSGLSAFATSASPSVK
ncbi:hypothetical protein AB1Y20_005850 [Prymnesium parvum]|uniref:Uncharacterized protein n=1 Tax=Prymnesium parvum TaxID=97485 RepID=A0AB34J384_PRYPA